MQKQLFLKLYSYKCESDNQAKKTKENKNNQKSAMSSSHSSFTVFFFKSTIWILHFATKLEKQYMKAASFK